MNSITNNESDIIVYKQTSDDWFPCFNFDNGTSLVMVSFFECELIDDDTERRWGVAVWGDDDCGMEKIFTNRSLALVCFDDIIRLKDVTKFALGLLQFVSA